MGGRGRETGVKGKGGKKPRRQKFRGVKSLKIQCGGCVPAALQEPFAAGEAPLGAMLGRDRGLCVLWV